MNVFLNEKTISDWTSYLKVKCVGLFGKTAKEGLGYPFSSFTQSIACLEKPGNVDSISLPEQNPPPIVAGAEKISTVEKFDPATLSDNLKVSKKHKLARIASLLENEVPIDETGLFFDCLPPDALSGMASLRRKTISSHEYDGHAVGIINSLPKDGIVLDCGSGLRPTYYENAWLILIRFVILRRMSLGWGATAFQGRFL